jgi:hypothetical protein
MRVSRAQPGLFSAKENKILTEKWIFFSRNTYFSDDYDSNNSVSRPAFPLHEFNRLLHETYNHFELPCPFEKLSEPGRVVRYEAEGMTVAFGYARKLNPCMLFSGRSFRKVPEAEMTDRPGMQASQS